MTAEGKHIFARLLFGFAAIFLACTVRAEDDGLRVLWWQVGDMTDPTSLGDVKVQKVNDGGETTAADLGVTHARIRKVSTDTYLKMLNPATQTFTLDAINVPMTWRADVSAYASGSPEYAFIIELGNWDGSNWSTLALSATVSYNSLDTNSHIDHVSGINPNPITPWVATSYVVPEPSSGLLLLVGAALLALRRRKRRAHG